MNFHLLRARREAGLTQVELARSAGVSNQTISRIERGEVEPDIKTMRALAHVLQVSLESLGVPDSGTTSIDTVTVEVTANTPAV